MTKRKSLSRFFKRLLQNLDRVSLLAGSILVGQCRWLQQVFQALALLPTALTY